MNQDVKQLKFLKKPFVTIALTMKRLKGKMSEQAWHEMVEGTITKLYVMHDTFNEELFREHLK